MKKPIFIGIAGGTGSGKSTFTNRLKETFGDRVSVVYYDNYYKRRDDLPFEERKKINYDHPDAFETELLIDQLYSLKNGQPVECPVYDYTVHNRSSETVLIKPADVILVEGIMVLQNPELRRLLEKMGSNRTLLHQGLCGSGCGRTDSAAGDPGREGARAGRGRHREAVPDHGEAHALSLCGTHPGAGGHRDQQRPERRGL